MLFLRHNLIATTYPLRSLTRRLSSKVPFDINDTDDKYKELNTMYSDMFTPTNSSHQPHTSEPTKKARTLSEEIAELNDEIDSVYHVNKPGISAEELESHVKSPGKFILKSISNNPYYNLALENYLFRNTPLKATGNGEPFTSQRLLFYINRPCAVIGKNQTVWQEVYLHDLEKRGYDLLRRLSGGGTVIHDLGNVNYSYITSRNQFDSSFFNKLIIRWLQNYDPSLPIELNKRGDILFDQKKCSGSAYKIASGKAYHHGTMLINSDLNKFHGLLKPHTKDGIHWETPSVGSVRSDISTIGLDSADDFIDICVDGFQTEFGDKTGERVPVYLCDEVTSITEDIRTTMETLQSDAWKYRSGPKFNVKFDESGAVIHVEKGIITYSNIQDLVGMPFKSIWQDAIVRQSIYTGKF